MTHPTAYIDGTLEVGVHRPTAGWLPMAASGDPLVRFIVRADQRLIPVAAQGRLAIAVASYYLATAELRQVAPQLSVQARLIGVPNTLYLKAIASTIAWHCSQTAAHLAERKILEFYNRQLQHWPPRELRELKAAGDLSELISGK